MKLKVKVTGEATRFTCDEIIITGKSVFTVDECDRVNLALKNGILTLIERIPEKEKGNKVLVKGRSKMKIQSNK